MIYLLGGAAVFLLLIYLYALYTQGEIRRLVRTLRWALGLGLVGWAGLLALGGRVGLASMLALAGSGILMRGRIGPLDLGGGTTSPNNRSKVKSRYFSMELDHDTGTVTGTVRAGSFAGAQLDDLDPDQCWALLNEIADDPDSVALFESWLDANRAGWRAQFAERFGREDDSAEAGEGAQSTGRGAAGGGTLGVAEAYEILGLAPGASASEITRTHRALMKKVHPDHGGSAFLAARINAAKDLLLKEVKRGRR